MKKMWLRCVACFMLGVIVAGALAFLGTRKTIDECKAEFAREVVTVLDVRQQERENASKYNETREAHQYLKNHPVVFPAQVESWDEWMGWLRTVDLSLDYPRQHEHLLRMAMVLDNYEQGFETVVYTIPYEDIHGPDGFCVEMDEMIILYNDTHEAKVYWGTENDVVMTVYIGQEFYNEDAQAWLDSWEESKTE